MPSFTKNAFAACAALFMAFASIGAVVSVPVTQSPSLIASEIA